VQEVNEEESLGKALLEALVHLHDPNYRPGDAISVMLGCAPKQNLADVQAALAEALEQLAPDRDRQSSDRATRPFEVLRSRFLLQLTQEETAERLYLSLRTVQREQRRGVYLLARRLLDRAEQPGTQENGVESRSTQAANWREQLKREMAWLQRYDQDAKADVRETLESVMPLAHKSVEQHGRFLRFANAAPNVTVSVHPSALRQVLLTAILELARSLPPAASLTLAFRETPGRLEITISGELSAASDPPDTTLLGELAALAGASLEMRPQGDQASLVIAAPVVEEVADRVTVLAVEDNLDLIALYQSYCEGTRYEIVHLWDPRRVFEAVETHDPDIILLDVLLPNANGWDLLLDLHANDATREVPIIVCSVITNKDLALALGAVQYLQKPVWRPQLIEAFTRALRQTEPASPSA